ncbi:MAG: ABC transporter permease [Hyphomicrobiales bacterium]|nr:ABC transporter permease [Hyphomicrobiales bacterium]
MSVRVPDEWAPSLGKAARFGKVRRRFALPKLGYASVTGWFLLAALASILVADIAITALDPWTEMRRLLSGIVRPDFLSIEAMSVVWTVAFAVLGVSIGASAGFTMALVFERSRIVRMLSAFLRSVHELFWALLLLQITGLSPLTGILAIALPYAGIFAKVFSEMIEEADLAAERVLPPRTSIVSRFAYARLPVISVPMKTYTLYRLECGLRSTLVLGFIGLPTIGFHLDSYFKQGNYAQAAALLFAFYVLIGSRRLWARASTIPFLIIASLLVLPEAVGGGSVWANLERFVTKDIVPSPLRNSEWLALDTWVNFGGWAWKIIVNQIVPGILQTLILSQIALAVTGLLALIVFPLVCRRFLGRAGHYLGRALLVVARSTPEYMLAYVLLLIMGPSMLPAIIALSLHNGAIIGYLLGRHADALEYRLDAPRGLNLYAFETVPRLYGQFLAYMLYRWEIILRESAIFGILGVATLGYHIDAAIAELRLDTAVFLILGVAALSMTVDSFSRWLRRRLLIEMLPTRLANAKGEQALPAGVTCR